MTPPSETWSIKIESFTHEVAGVSKTLLRPMAGQRFPASMQVEGNKSLVKDYPVGSRFKVMVSPMKRPGGAYLFTSWQWDVVLLLEDGSVPPPDRASLVR